MIAATRSTKLRFVAWLEERQVIAVMVRNNMEVVWHVQTGTAAKGAAVGGGLEFFITEIAVWELSKRILCEFIFLSGVDVSLL
jgi:hypothetical protein